MSHDEAERAALAAERWFDEHFVVTVGWLQPLRRRPDGSHRPRRSGGNVKIIDIRIEVPDEAFDEAWRAAEHAARIIEHCSNMLVDWRGHDDFAIEVFDCSEEQ